MGRPLHLKFFADFIATDLGIVYTEANDFQLEKRLDVIAKARGIASALRPVPTVFEALRHRFAPDRA